jgi:hypothetical protein
MHRLEVRKVERVPEQSLAALSQSVTHPSTQTSPAPIPTPRPPSEPAAPGPVEVSPGRADELLSRPIESLGLESLDDPLA